MANLSETSAWENGIYQLETSDPVMGGENGISNRAAKQLANRTLWLKNEITAKENQTNNLLATKANKTVTVSGGLGLTGGGDLTTSRTISVDFATANDMGTANKVVGAFLLQNELDKKPSKNTTVTAGTGLTGGGTLAANFSIAADMATAADYTAGTTGKVVGLSLFKTKVEERALKSETLGNTQTRQLMTEQRVAGTNYTNNTGKPIVVSIICNATATQMAALTVGGIDTCKVTVNQTDINFASIVAPGETYRFVGTFTRWVELR